MNKYLTSIIIIIVVFFAGAIAGKYYFAKTEIKIVDRVEYKTEWKTKIEYINTQENFESLYKCYQSPIQFKDEVKENYLFVTAFDDCKENKIKYEIGTRGNWKIYAGIGAVGIIAGGIITYKLTR